MGLIKIFSGNQNMAANLQTAISKTDVAVTQRENKQHSGQSLIVELFIEEDDFLKVRDVIEDFKMNL